MKPLLSFLASTLLAGVALAQPDRPILINKAFEGGSIGKIEKLGDTEFRMYVEGQYDERGRNRQPSWFYFRMDQVAGRELTLRLTDFGGEYNDLPSAARISPRMRPVYSEDGRSWRHLDETVWNAETKELTLTLRPSADTVWVAYQAPYGYSRIRDLNAEIGDSRWARLEVIGQSVRGRPIEAITVSDFSKPDDAKKHLWLIARQHAWESGTSFVVEGALRFIVSDDPVAQNLREQAVITIVPTMDPDGCALNHVRFNANGYDVNRNWEKVDLRDPSWLRKMPEIWYVKRAVRDAHARRPIDLLVNLHNNAGNEYLETTVDADEPLAMLHRFFGLLRDETIFDPSRPAITISAGGQVSMATTNGLWNQFGVPTVLIEQRIEPSQKLGGRRPTTEDRLVFGPQLLRAMLAAVKPAL